MREVFEKSKTMSAVVHSTLATMGHLFSTKLVQCIVFSQIIKINKKLHKPSFYFIYMCPETNNFSSIQEKNNNQASTLYSTWVRFVLRWQAKTRYIHARTNTFVMIVFREREVLCRRKKNIERRRDEERQNNRENEKKKNNHHFGHTRKFCTGLRSHVHVRRTVNEEKNTIYAYFVVRSLCVRSSRTR